MKAERSATIASMSTVKTCYLVGGAPLSGKSTLADILAAEHLAVQISTDNIRDWMIKVTNKADYPRLFYGHELGPEEYYRKYDTARKVMEGEIEQGKDVEAGIRALLECFLPWERMVIEGIGITPEFAVNLAKEFPDIQFETRILYDDNDLRIKHRISERGLWGSKGTYPDYIKDKEFEWVKLYNEYFKIEADKYKLELTKVVELLG